MMKQQKGMVLVVAMILLIPLTLAALAVMQWSRSDATMTSASSQRLATEQVQKGIAQDILTTSTLRQKIYGLSSTSGSSTTIAVNNSNRTITLVTDTTCKASVMANSTNLYSSCKYVDTQYTSNYGKGLLGVMTSALGIEQPITTVSKQ